MAAMPIYMIKTFKNLQNRKSYMILKLGIEHWELKLYEVMLMIGLTLTYCIVRSNLVACMVKLIESHLMGNNLQQMIKVI